MSFKTALEVYAVYRGNYFFSQEKRRKNFPFYLTSHFLLWYNAVRVLFIYQISRGLTLVLCVLRRKKDFLTINLTHGAVLCFWGLAAIR